MVLLLSVVYKNVLGELCTMPEMGAKVSREEGMSGCEFKTLSPWSKLVGTVGFIFIFIYAHVGGSKLWR